MSRPFAPVAFLLSLAAAGHFGPAVAAPVPKGAESKSWVGKTVMPKKPGTLGAYKNAPPDLPRLVKPDGTPRELTRTMYAAAWEVKSESGTRVEVAEGGVAFWMEKERLVPLGEAVGFYTKALEGESKEPYLYNFRGWARHLLGKDEEAVKDFGEFMKRSPTDDANAIRQRQFAGLNNRGLALAATGKFDEAIKDFDEAMRLGNSSARLNRGWTYDRKGDYRRAADDYAAILDARPGNPAALNNMAWLKATCPDAAFRDGKEAVRLAKQLCELAGPEGMYLDTLAAAHAEAGDFAAAVEAEEKALQDGGYVRKRGDDALVRLRLYQQKKPFRSQPRK
jgi:tetratricopeptide (TPR) repeat protein